MSDEQTGKEIRAGKGESHWKLIRASVLEAANKGYVPPADIWKQIEKMVAGIKDNSPEAAFEDSMRFKFEQDGIAPEVAERMAKEAAEPRGGRVLG